MVAGFNALYDRWDGRGEKTGARFGAPEHVTLVVTPDSPTIPIGLTSGFRCGISGDCSVVSCGGGIVMGERTGGWSRSSGQSSIWDLGPGSSNCNPLRLEILTGPRGSARILAEREGDPEWEGKG